MVKNISAEDILKKNPQVNKDEVDAVAKIISETSGGKIMGGHKVYHSPYSRPSVRLDKQSPPACRVSTRRC